MIVIFVWASIALIFIEVIKVLFSWVFGSMSSGVSPDSSDPMFMYFDFDGDGFDGDGMWG